MAPTFNNNYPQHPYSNGLHTPSAVKHEEPPWFAPGNSGAPQTDQKPTRGGGGVAGLKSEQSMIQQLKNEPRVPAPGEAEGIVIRTKFPVARIKRIVQADEDVGKVAQVTPVVVCKFKHGLMPSPDQDISLLTTYTLQQKHSNSS